MGNDLSGPVIQENISYYDQYISGEMSKGRPEQEVLEELGDPWVLAQTVIHMAKNKAEQTEGYRPYGGQQEESSPGEEAYPGRHIFSNWKWILVILGIVGIFVMIVAVVGGIVSFLAPVILPLLIVALLIRIVRQWRGW